MTAFNIKDIRALMLDMDGVLWRGDQQIGNLATIFTEIKDRRKKVILASNNSTKTPGQYLARMDSYGVELEDWQVINSAEATAEYLRKQYPDGGEVYVVGEEGLVRSLQAKGFSIGTEGVIAVVAGMDRFLDYEKILTAARLIREGAAFIGTNPDRTFPTPDGLTPGAGTMLAAIEAASDVKPLVIGKPKSGLFQIALERLDCRPKETLMVGDRLETDIAGAQNMGCPTALVLSGITSATEAQQWQPKIDLISDDLTSLVKML